MKLAEALLESVDLGSAEGAEAAWSAEAKPRLEEVRTGAAELIRQTVRWAYHARTDLLDA
jgi:hypothetical protein